MAIAEPQNVAFSSFSGIDKVVRTFTGSYNAATDLTSRNYTSGGSPLTAYFYRIPHGLTRPVFCELITSDDGGTYYVDGGNSSGGIGHIAFSDSTYIYIFHSIISPGTGTINYKVWCSWIDDYDGTNPSIETISYTDQPIEFDSRENFQKLAMPQQLLTFSAGTFGSTETQNVIHTLGYTPNTKVFFEAFSGEVWPLNAGGTSNIFRIDDSQDEAYISITSSLVSVSMDRFSNTSKRAWVRVFYDD